jgi:hypothetical protein
MICSRCLKKVQQLYYKKGQPGKCEPCFYGSGA